MKFRKKPVVVEAHQWIGPDILVPGVMRECGFRGCTFDPSFGVFLPNAETRHMVVTAHGQAVYLEPGDWVVPEPDGVHFYPVKPDIFAATYEPVDEAGGSE